MERIPNAELCSECRHYEFQARYGLTCHVCTGVEAEIDYDAVRRGDHLKMRKDGVE